MNRPSWIAAPLFACGLVICALAACSPAAEDPTPLTGNWTLDSKASRLDYVTIKQGTIVEANSFERLSGSVSADGAAEIVIELASVSTGIDIRDERMREVLFNVSANPSAAVKAQLDPAEFAAGLSLGESMRVNVEAQLLLAGTRQPIDLELQVTRIAQDRVQVASAKPVVVSAASFELTPGLDRLRELAGLESITPAVPVTFSVVFER